MQIELKFTSDIEKILDTYKPNEDPFDDDADNVRILKYIIFKELNDIEKRLIILYTEYRSFRKVASSLNISPSTVYIYVNNIRKKIKHSFANHVKHKYC